LPLLRLGLEMDSSFKKKKKKAVAQGCGKCPCGKRE
jgi:hypothetical protein